MLMLNSGSLPSMNTWIIITVALFAPSTTHLVGGENFLQNGAMADNDNCHDDFKA